MENPRSYIIIVGDLNRDRLPFLETMGYNNLVNFVTFPRSNTILDAVYVKGWSYFTAKKMHPIATSDHFSVLIMPRYTERYREVQKIPRPKERDTRKSNVDNLRVMLDSTDWRVFTDTCDTLDELTQVVSSYINFTTDICIPYRTMSHSEVMKRLPAGDKIKQLEKEKKEAIDDGDTTLRNRLQRQINKHVFKRRNEYFQKVTTDKQSLWDLLKSIRKPDEQQRNLVTDEFGQKLSQHFGRFNDASSKDISLILSRPINC
ncbi:hypothetical protein BSL78_18283 [Apostichopus japonicus]|uniref:Endonuclease/exonuclease/phosphatase domain-containing protein n=1 Tax=Stichopus japonicus TaxID=307972 RepID=A0A2G8KA47_STIJA|nr:hypothetical protein BSL78_18283 [Apostichopus japonicus]